MLIIRKGQTNNLIATVSMNKTLPNPYYLFSFQNITSKEKISFIPEVITTNTRYDKFRFVEGPTDLTQTPPVAFFKDLSQYYYSIYEQVSSGNTNPALAYNKLESGRAVVIVGNSQTDECLFEPYISPNEDGYSIIYLSEQEEACLSGVTPTPTITQTPSPTPSTTPGLSPTPTGTPNPTSTPTSTSTPIPTSTQTGTPTQTPTLTPTPSSSPSPAPLSFIVTSGQSQFEACNSGYTMTLYAQDLGNCGGCAPLTCWACLMTSQTLYLDSGLTIKAPNGFYTNEMSSGNYATWFVINGKPQSSGFYGGCSSTPPSPPSGSHAYSFTGYSANTTYSTSCNANPASGGTLCIVYGDNPDLDLNVYLYNVSSGLSTVNMFGQYYFPAPQPGPSGNFCLKTDSYGAVKGLSTLCSSLGC